MLAAGCDVFRVSSLYQGGPCGAAGGPRSATPAARSFSDPLQAAPAAGVRPPAGPARGGGPGPRDGRGAARQRPHSVRIIKEHVLAGRAGQQDDRKPRQAREPAGTGFRVIPPTSTRATTRVKRADPAQPSRVDERCPLDTRGWDEPGRRDDTKPLYREKRVVRHALPKVALERLIELDWVEYCGPRNRRPPKGGPRGRKCTHQVGQERG
jgi:hypothetical protein